MHEMWRSGARGRGSGIALTPGPWPLTPDPERQERAREYGAIKRRLFFVDLAISAVLVLAFLFSGLSVWLADRMPGPPSLATAVYFVVLIVAYTLILAPLEYFSGFVLPHRYGLSTQTLGAWLWDQTKTLGLGLLFGVVALEAVYGLLRTFPDIWWLLAAALMVCFTVVLSSLAPVLIVPLFYKLRPLEDTELARRLTSLAERAGTRVRGVFVIEFSSKTTAANAALAGLGRTRRILLGDTLLDRFSADEIEVILAHELAHQVHRDIPKGIVVESAIQLASFFLASLVLAQAVGRLGFRGIDDLAAFPLLAIVFGVVALLAMPLINAFTRGVERAADWYALRSTDNPSAFISMMTKLTDQNLSEARPPRWVEVLFYSHPPSVERVAMAERYGGRQ